MSRIVITVAGGFVQNVYTEDGDLEYLMLDEDMADHDADWTVELAHGDGTVLRWGAFLPQESAYGPDFVDQAFRAHRP